MSTHLTDLIGTGSAARVLGVSEARIRQIVLEGRLPCTETPLGRLFDPADVRRLVAERDARKGTGQ